MVTILSSQIWMMEVQGGIWSLGAMILEADMEKDHYLNVDSERVAQNLCQKHLRDI
jgi:hypothetical protein